MKPTEPARAWTPADALRDGRLEAHLTELARSWVKDWWRAPKTITIRSDLSFCTRRATNAEILRPGSGLGFILPRHAFTRLGAALVDYASPAPKTADEPILHAIAASCLDDLLHRIEALCGAGDVCPAKQHNEFDEAARFALTITPGFTFDLIATRSSLMAARRQLSPARKTTGGLGRLSTALDKQPIELGVSAGAATLGLDQFKTLAVGDVISLDRALDQDLNLTVHGNTPLDLHCRIERDGRQGKLQLTHVT